MLEPTRGRHSPQTRTIEKESLKILNWRQLKNAQIFGHNTSRD